MADILGLYAQWYFFLLARVHSGNGTFPDLCKERQKELALFLASVASSLVPDRLIHSTDLASVAASLVSDCLIYTNFFYFYDYTIQLRHSQHTHNHLYQRTYAIHNDSQ